MLYYVEWLRTLAVLLIIHSHLDSVYPINIATGGELGLALFFMIIGHLMGDIDRTKPFGKWYSKKLLRLYIPVLLVTPIRIWATHIAVPTIWDVVYRYVWPTTYWFVGATAIHYVIFYLFARNYNTHTKWKPVITCGFLAGIVLIFAVGYWQLDKTKLSIRTYSNAAQAVWLLCMLVGFYLRLDQKKPQKRSMAIAGCICSIAVYGAAKFTLALGRLLGLQFVPGLAAVGFAASMFMLLMHSEQQLKTLSTKTWIGKLILVISKRSMEIYAVQITVIYLLKGIVFPLNLVAICVCILLAGILVHWVSDKISKVLLWKTARCAGK